MITAWAVALVAWVVVLMLPERYEASARVFVDARTPLRPVLEGIAIEPDYESQLSLVREALLSRPQLEAVARQTRLDMHADTPAALDAVVNALQKQIEITGSVAGNPQAQVRNAIYAISYQNSDRAKSLEVVQRLLTNFEQGTLSGSQSGANEAQSFLNGQIGELEKRLQVSEERLAEFKKRNLGMLPGERGDYFTRMNQEMAGLQRAETDLAVAVARRAELRRQLASAKVYLPGTNNGVNSATPDITARRQEAEKRLEDLLLRFTDKHPEVIALRRTIADLKQSEAKELAELQRGGAGSGEIRSLSANPVYQQIQSQLSQVDVEIASHQGAADQHRQEIANLRKFVDQAPEVEQELARLNRDYNVTKAQYDQLVTRREQARVSDDAARAGIVRFQTIEPPHADLKPVSPKRKLLFIAVLFLAAGAGLGVGLLPHLLRPTVGDIASLELRFGLPVLGAVSTVRTAEQSAQQRRQILHVMIAGGLLVSLAGLLVIIGDAGARILQNLLA